MRTFLNRPDHLTRSAQELSRWRAAVDLASAAPLDGSLPVETVTVAGTEPAAYITNASAAHRVTATIGRSVARVRAAGAQQH